MTLLMILLKETLIINCHKIILKNKAYAQSVYDCMTDIVRRIHC